jgi:DNA invertase Pin-like site-specific DNA recombinase
MAKNEYAGSVGFSYARFSDPSQGTGHSIERQESYAPTFCDEFGITLNTTLTFKDEGKSAFKGEHLQARGELQRFLACIEAGFVKQGDVLIVENLDRLSRLELSAAEQLLHSILSQGVRIHTRSPWAIYDKKTLNNPMERMQMIFEFTRSHRESRSKQERLSRRWEHNRERLRQGTYHLSNLPGWLKLKDSKDKTKGYVTIPERVATVRLIFQLSIDGLGLNSIARHLNEKQVATFGRADYWQKSTISKILHNRSVLGEYQPYTSVHFDGDGREYKTVKRVPTGDAIQGHYPSIVDEELFNRAALALNKRDMAKTGARPESTNNLFTGLVIDVRDGSKMHVVEKDGFRLVSSKSLAGATDDKRLPIPYGMFEDAFVAFVDQMPLSLVMPKKSKSFDTQILKLEKEVQALQLQVEQLKEKTRKNSSDILLELLVERDQELRQKRAEIEALERQKGSTAGMAAKSSKAILEHLSKATGDDLSSLRLKLRNEIRYWIKEIYVLPLELGGVRAFIAEVELNNGKSFTFRASRQLIDWPTELDGLEIQKFNDWPKNIRKTSWDAETELDRQIRELDDAGHQIQYIASELGIKPSTVSKMLIAMGRRRSQRRPVDSDQLMTWHPQGAGWQRIYKGKRYFVGMGTLQALYPRLVKGRNKEGSIKAANRWWTDHGPKD